MSVLSIALLTISAISLVIVYKTKQLNIIIQRILFFGFFVLAACCVPEAIHNLYKTVGTNWLEVLFDDWFNKDAFANMIAKALAWIMIISAILLVVWGLWRLFLLATKKGIRSWGATVASIAVILAVIFAEFFNGFYTFSNISDFFGIKLAANAQFELLPNKVIYYETDDPVSEICQAEKFNLLTEPSDYTRLQLKIDGDVYIFRNTATKEPGFYPLNN